VAGAIFEVEVEEVEVVMAVVVVVVIRKLDWRSRSEIGVVRLGGYLAYLIIAVSTCEVRVQ
jgi:hypothetical protein